MSITSTELLKALKTLTPNELESMRKSVEKQRSETLEKIAKVQERLRKVTAERDDMADKLAKVTASYAALLQRLAPPKGVLKAVPKTR